MYSKKNNSALSPFVILSSVLSTGKRINREDQKLRVIATIFPIYDFARNKAAIKLTSRCSCRRE